MEIRYDRKISHGRTLPWPRTSDLRRGERVRVRPKDEILSTLNKDGCLDGIPFMPEMIAFCGQSFVVSSRAGKSCDTALQTGARRVPHAVHLSGVRCDGSAHGGCQALCLTWWHEAWLLRAEERAFSGQLPNTVCDEEHLHASTRMRSTIDATIFRCQATRLPEFSIRLRWWDPRPLVREIRTGNISLPKALNVIIKAGLNIIRRKTGRGNKPRVVGQCKGPTPTARIPNLHPGDWVVVKPQEDIEATLDKRQRNRGLYFDIEMLPYCGRRMRLLRKVDRIIDERTGAMRRIPNDCWILEGGVCTGLMSQNRLFCGRRIYGFWREIWFEPVDGEQQNKIAEMPEASRATSGEA